MYLYFLESLIILLILDNIIKSPKPKEGGKNIKHDPFLVGNLFIFLFIF